MNPTSELTTTRHIVVTLDASESDPPALATAVRLAAILGAEIKGIFVEDINLIHLAELPFLREVRLWSLAEETISTQRMLRELRTQARHAERMLEQVAREMGVPWSFQVWRGNAGAENLAQTFGTDIISLGRIRSLACSRRWATTRSRTRQSRESIASINILLSRSERAAHVLMTACSLAKDLGVSLTILLPDSQAEDIRDVKEKARTILDSLEQPAQFVQLSGNSVQSLVQAASTSGTCILISEAEHPLLQQAGLDQCLEALACTMLLVR